MNDFEILPDEIPTGGGGAAGGGGGVSMPYYPTSRGGISSGYTPKLIVEREMGRLTFTVYAEGDNVQYTNLSPAEMIARVKAWI